MLLQDITLSVGKHLTPEQGMCLIEAVSYIAGEAFSDEPQCVCPVLSSYGRRLNDTLDTEDRKQLVAYIPKLIGTADGRSAERSWFLMDAAVRVFAPDALDLAGMHEVSLTLRSLPKVDSQRLRDLVMEKIREVFVQLDKVCNALGSVKQCTPEASAALTAVRAAHAVLVIPHGITTGPASSLDLRLSVFDQAISLA